MEQKIEYKMERTSERGKRTCRKWESPNIVVDPLEAHPAPLIVDLFERMVDFVMYGGQSIELFFCSWGGNLVVRQVDNLRAGSHPYIAWKGE